MEASVWRDNLDRELGASLGAHTEDEVGKQKLGGNRAIDGVCLCLYLIPQPSLITPARRGLVVYVPSTSTPYTTK